MEDMQIPPSSGRVLNQGDGVALRCHRRTSFKPQPQPQCVGRLVGVRSTSMRDGEVRDDAPVFASVRPKAREGFRQSLRHRDERRLGFRHEVGCRRKFGNRAQREGKGRGLLQGALGPLQRVSSDAAWVHKGNSTVR
jgi:hypothetical protein